MLTQVHQQKAALCKLEKDAQIQLLNISLMEDQQFALHRYQKTRKTNPNKLMKQQVSQKCYFTNQSPSQVSMTNTFRPQDSYFSRKRRASLGDCQKFKEIHDQNKAYIFLENKVRIAKEVDELRRQCRSFLKKHEGRQLLESSKQNRILKPTIKTCDYPTQEKESPKSTQRDDQIKKTNKIGSIRHLLRAKKQ